MRGESARLRWAVRLMRLGCGLLVLTWLAGVVFDWLGPDYDTWMVGWAVVWAVEGAILVIVLLALLWPTARLVRVWRARSLGAALAVALAVGALRLENSVCSGLTVSGVVNDLVGIWGWAGRHHLIVAYLGMLNLLDGATFLLAVPFGLALRREPGLRWSGRIVLIAVLVNAIVKVSGFAVDMGLWWSMAQAQRGVSGHAWWPAALIHFNDWAAWPAWLSILAVLVMGAARAPALLRGPRGRNACPECGYGLDGIAPGACPECGWRLGAPGADA